MATVQHGTGSLAIEGGSVGTLEQKAAVLAGTLVSGTIAEAVSVDEGGSPTTSRQETSSGAFHTTLVHENRQHQMSATLVGKETSLRAGQNPSGSDYLLDKVHAVYGRAAVKTEVSGTRVKNLS